MLVLMISILTLRTKQLKAMVVLYLCIQREICTYVYIYIHMSVHAGCLSSTMAGTVKGDLPKQ